MSDKEILCPSCEIRDAKLQQTDRDILPGIGYDAKTGNFQFRVYCSCGWSEVRIIRTEKVDGNDGWKELAFDSVED